MAPPGRIGRYAILGELGQGAMGIVYRARDETLDRDVAIKVMSRGLADKDARARFLREAKAAARLQHPNIVVIYELGEHEGAPFMALELLEGIDLQRGIEAGVRPDPRATLPVVLQLLAGLGHAHENGIVHRDVKPSNVFLPLGRPAKIMDFGVARLTGLGTTTSGVITGTPNYMSPEQASAGEIDGRSDLFSAALILYELVTGERAFKADSVVAVMYRILHEAPDLSLISRGPEWERLCAVLARALARQRDERFPDARAMSAELVLALLDLGGSTDWSGTPADQALLVRPRAYPRPPAPPAPSAAATPEPPEPRQPTPATPPARRERFPLRAALAVGVVALAGLAAWLTLRPGAITAPVASPGPLETRGSSPPHQPATLQPVTAPPASAAPATTAPARPPATMTPRPDARVPPTPAPPQPSAAPEEVPVPTAAPGLDPPARLARARDFLERSLYAQALAEARAVLQTEPANPEATTLAQQAEAELVIEDCLHNARAALKSGDRERALEEIRRGFLIRKTDPRLLALHREAVQQ
jgi:tRNA A-37 threonylcarbamoyl transferase component Bud32